MATRVAAAVQCGRQVIIVIDVARNASRAGVGIGQGEARRTVIENSRGPGGDRVACRAGRSRRREP